MSEPTVVRSFNIGGVAVDVFSTDWLCSHDTNNTSQNLETISTLPITVLILLHGRTRDKLDMRSMAEKALRFAREKTLRSVNGSEQLDLPSHELIVVTLDHRNHGARTVDAFSNQGWNKEPEKHNIRHAIDMYAIQTGTAQDVSLLIDFLPSYLFPNGERTIDIWAVAGVSLGGHSTWHCLKDDPRVTVGIPIIGCPDFLTLMTARAHYFAGNTLNVDNPTGPPAFPISLIAHITKTSPVPPLTESSTAVAYSHTDLDARINPFIGKKILILSGAEDRLVPWTTSEKFVEGLQVGPSGRKEIFVQEGVGHDCTEEMGDRLAEFVWQESLAKGVQRLH